MILIDSSVWANHFRGSNPLVSQLLIKGQAAMHPFVLGELACGNLKKRAETLADFRRLPLLPLATDAEVHHLLESHRLWGTGLGWVDMHVLASALFSSARLWTADRDLALAARRLHIGFEVYYN